jgi:nucleotide-binding universal stress UspA family protein
MQPIFSRADGSPHGKLLFDAALCRGRGLFHCSWRQRLSRKTSVTFMRNSIPFHHIAAKKLLLATDFSAASSAAFRASLSLCDQFGASLYVLHVVEYDSRTRPESSGLLIDSDRFHRDAAFSVGSLIEEARRAGVACEGTLVTGRADDSILDVLHAQSCDLVVLGTRGIRGFEHLVFGSTAEAVIRNAGRPVLTVGPRSGSPLLHNNPTAGIALFATDFHVVTTEAIRYAALFAKTMNLPLHCLHVLPRGMESDVSRPRISSLITDALKHLVAGLDLGPGLSVSAVTYGSEISNTVIAYARSHHARLIVLGVRRSSLAASHIPAHITYRVITEAPCPVLMMAFPIAPKRSTVDLSEAGQPEVTTSA